MRCDIGSGGTAGQQRHTSQRHVRGELAAYVAGAAAGASVQSCQLDATVQPIQLIVREPPRFERHHAWAAVAPPLCPDCARQPAAGAVRNGMMGVFCGGPLSFGRYVCRSEILPFLSMFCLLSLKRSSCTRPNVNGKV